MPTRCLISDRILILGTLRPGAVAIRDGRIVGVATDPDRRLAGELLALTPSEPSEVVEVEDLGGAILAPAFVDAHTHLALHALRGGAGPQESRWNLVEDFFYRFEHGLTHDEVRAFARVGAMEALTHGTGLVFDHYFHGDAIAEALTDVGLTGVVAPTVQDLGGPFEAEFEAGLEATVRLDTRAWRQRGIGAALGPHAMDTVSPALWRRVTDIAARRRMPVHVHVAQSIDEVRRVFARTGRSPVAELIHQGVLDAAPRTMLIHGIYAPTEDLASLVGKKVDLGVCPHSAWVFGHPARVDEWERHGLSWFVGSDCAASNDALDVRGELRAILGFSAMHGTWSRSYGDYLETGDLRFAEEAFRARTDTRDRLARLQSPDELLGLVTRVPGAIHPHLSAGVIAPGCLANFTLWDPGHPCLWPASDPIRALALANPAPALLQVMTLGQWRGERGRYVESLRQSETWQAWTDEATGRLTERLARVRLH
ncbi:MAG: amidohydrolase family protein [Myxococcales bacterium]|nr:amidohydrolase family protein [Myxococcales bacterium]